MLIKNPSFDPNSNGNLEKRRAAITVILGKVIEIGVDLGDSELEWAIKMEDAFKKYGNLTDPQLDVLINILVKHLEV